MFPTRLPAALILGLTVAYLASGQQAPDRAAALKACEEGKKHEAAKEFDQAIAAYTRAIALDPTLEDAYLSRSRVHGSRPDLKNRDYALAVADLDQIIRLSPKQFAARFGRATYYVKMNKHDEAIAECTRIIDGPTDYSGHPAGKDPCLAVAYLVRGQSFSGVKKDYDLAIKDFTEAIRLSPKLTDARSERGQCYWFKKDYAKAQEDFAAGLKINPDHMSLLNESAWMMATCPDATFRDGRKAVELAERANKAAQSRVYQVLDTLAAAHAEVGKFDKAIDYEKQAIDLLGGKPEAEVKQMEARLSLYRAGKPYRAE